MEGIEKKPNRKNEGLNEGVKRLVEKAGGHFRTLKEEIERVEWRIEEYKIDPSSEKWKAMVDELALLANMQTTPPLLVKDLDHERNTGNTEDGWPGGTRTWRK